MERFEEQGELLRGNPGAGVDDIETEEGALAFEHALDSHGDFPVVSKLAGVAQEIEQALPDLEDVGKHAADAGGKGEIERICVLGGKRANELDNFADELRDVEGSGVNLDFTGL